MQCYQGNVLGQRQRTFEQEYARPRFGFMQAFEELFNRPDRRTTFLDTVRIGDILISKSGIISGMIGHAAIMATDYWVVEMPGAGVGTLSSSSSTSSSSEDQTLEDNNRRIDKYSWFDEHESDFSITVYRCPDDYVAVMAAKWAYAHYYNATGGELKTIHIRYSLISPIFSVTDPSYCSKLVMQAYHFGSDVDNVTSVDLIVMGVAIRPSNLVSFFTPRYKPQVVARV